MPFVQIGLTTYRDYALFKDREAGQRTLLVFTDLSGQAGVHQKTTTLSQALTTNVRSWEGHPAFPEVFSEPHDIHPPTSYPHELQDTIHPDGNFVQDQPGWKGVRAGLQSPDPMDRQIALMELGPLSPVNPELLLGIEYLSAQDSDPGVKETATEMLKHFSHQE